MRLFLLDPANWIPPHSSSWASWQPTSTRSRRRPHWSQRLAAPLGRGQTSLPQRSWPTFSFTCTNLRAQLRYGLAAQRLAGEVAKKSRCGILQEKCKLPLSRRCAWPPLLPLATSPARKNRNALPSTQKGRPFSYLGDNRATRRVARSPRSALTTRRLRARRRRSACASTPPS